MVCRRGDKYLAFDARSAELFLLAEYYADQVIDHELFVFTSGCAESMDWPNDCLRRLEQIAKAVGLKPVQKVFAEVEDKYRRKVGDRVWDAYKRGDQEERTVIIMELMTETDEPRDSADAPTWAVDEFEVHPGFAYVEGTQKEYRCLFSVHRCAEALDVLGVTTVRQQRRGTGTPLGRSRSALPPDEPVFSFAGAKLITAKASTPTTDH